MKHLSDKFTELNKRLDVIEEKLSVKVKRQKANKEVNKEVEVTEALIRRLFDPKNGVKKNFCPECMQSRQPFGSVIYHWRTVHPGKHLVLPILDSDMPVDDNESNDNVGALPPKEKDKETENVQEVVEDEGPSTSVMGEREKKKRKLARVRPNNQLQKKA